MSDCCSTNNTPDNSTGRTAPNKHICPVNGKPYTKIPRHTIFHHLKQPWLWSHDDKEHEEQNYYFCDDPDCDVVYFAEDNRVIYSSQLRTKVGIKERDNSNELVCYCFGVTFSDAQLSDAPKAFVIEKTKQKICACETRNPSGRCCLKDFPKR